jgi:hypothetical protein
MIVFASDTFSVKEVKLALLANGFGLVPEIVVRAGQNKHLAMSEQTG